jgi:RNA polymerase sigma-70 factor (ECF subfamily)
MSPTAEAFQALIRRVRAGDQEASTEFVRLYEPQIRRFVRFRLTDPHLARVVDSVDICQSVLSNFFVRAVMGQFDLDEPSALLKLLFTMARHKLVDHHRREKARRTEVADSALWSNIPDDEQTPSHQLANAELLDAVRRQLSGDERWLAEQRADGKSWPEIARLKGGSAEALRKQYERALDRACDELGLME